MLLQAVNELTVGSWALRCIVDEHGPPPLWLRKPGFESLVFTIIEQQVSLASARAVFERLKAALGTIQAYGKVRPRVYFAEFWGRTR
jgi:DNA-3-methyladenine glycosylase II